ncbi:Histone-lysine N-methyltransferase ASHH1 [Linum grandiflorum]
MDQESQVLPLYEHIQQNEFSHRKHKKQKEEDIAVCECKFDANDPDSACFERCLNWLTSTECTPGHCPCDIHCKNQKFQNCQYAKTKLVKTEGRGWGLLADENIKAGQFIIEYCGEVISCKVARRRSYYYESEGQQDAYIISLNASESIDATRKGSHARFINHSCQPNCETRKWNVLGEIRVGIFAKQDISIGTELSYDYNFEWYGGAKVRCLCGAAGCSGFLGAKSRGFQNALVISRIRSNSACRNHQIGSSPIPNKRTKKIAAGRAKQLIDKQVDVKRVAQLLSLKEAKQEVLIYEELKNDATSQLSDLYCEIRPAIEEHERDSQDSVATSVAEKWIEACCTKFKAEFDLCFSIIKNVASNPPKKRMDMDSDVKYLGM